MVTGLVGADKNCVYGIPWLQESFQISSHVNKKYDQVEDSRQPVKKTPDHESTT